MKNRGLTVLELVVGVTLAGILMAIAIPVFQPVRLGAAVATAEQELSALLHRARWLAITSGRPATTVELDNCAGPKCTKLSVKNGTTVLISTDVAEHNVELSAVDFPFTFDSRGFIPGGLTPTLRVSSPKVSRTRTLSLTPLGKLSG